MSGSHKEEINYDTSEAKVKLTIANVSRLVEFWSSPVKINGLNWFVQVAKANLDDEDQLCVYLHASTIDDGSSNWNCAAWALVKLISFSDDSNKDSIIKPINPDVYDPMIGWGVTNFITWTDLFDAEKRFVQKDAIVLEVIIKANEPVIGGGSNEFEWLDRCCASASSGKFRWTVHNVGHLLAATSPQFLLRNQPWELSAFRVGTSISYVRDMFGISIRCKNSNPNWTWNVTMSLSFLSPTEDGKMKTVFTQNINECVFNASSPSASFVLLWHNLIKPENEIINNDSAIIECEIRLQSPKVNCVNNPRKRRFQAELRCAICLENIFHQRVSSTRCGHLFCTKCIEKAIELRNQCPLCNTETKLGQLQRIHLPM